ncbi:MAG TPA: protein kinase [Candidatus Acidoferrales bacterium]|nr:protein kinase [Candidatus Acidoferrales bacterium]
MPSNPMTGQTLGHYKIIEKLGAGGMGEVYSAHDARLEREIALKILPAGMLADDAARKRFRKEALALSKLNHPNIATIYDFDTDSGVDFLAMEYVRGETLAEKVAGGALPEKELAALGEQIAGSLEEAHEHGIVHRDLKPGNIMVTPKGRVKVLDFGLAKLARPMGGMTTADTLSEVEGAPGTLPYMAPEQLQGEPADARSDIFSFGAVLYEMATGRRPFREEMASRLTDAILHQAPVAPRAMNPRTTLELERIILKCLEKEPDHRYQSAKEVGVDLRRLAAPSVSAAPAGVPSGTARRAVAGWRLAVMLAAAAAALAIGVSLWLQRTEYFWRNPITDARFQTVTDFEGVEEAAAVSRDGHFVAFLSDRDGPMDVWVTQVGSGQFHNLTHGSAPELVNPYVRNLGFTPDGSLVTYWVGSKGRPGGGISIWAVPTLGGQPRPYLEGVAEFDWTRDGSRLAYHTPGPGDPLFVSDGSRRPEDRPIFTAPTGLHSHFTSWGPDSAFIYFVQGALPDKLDIWRITPAGGTPERITSHTGRVTYPVLLDRRTLMYLASDPDSSGPRIYSMDVERRIPHRLTSGLDRYTSLAASADGRRLVATLASPKRTLWRLPIVESPADVSAPARISLTTSAGFSPRLGPDYLLYVSAAGTNESIWKVINGTGAELWSGKGAQVFGGPAISPDGRYIAFSVRQHEQTLLYVMQADGANARIVADSLDLRGAPAWAPDGKSITSAANSHGVPHLFRVPVDGGSPASFVEEYSTDPAWAPDGGFVVYSGPDIGTRFPVKGVTAEAAAHPLPALTLTRGARHLAFLPGGRALVFLRGEIQHKNLWLVDLETGAERQLTNLPADFEIGDFDISPDGREVVLERVQERSDVVLLDLMPS